MGPRERHRVSVSKRSRWAATSLGASEPHGHRQRLAAASRAPAEKDSGWKHQLGPTRTSSTTIFACPHSSHPAPRLATMSSTPTFSSRRAAFGGQLTGANANASPGAGASPATDPLPALGYSLTPSVTPPPGLDQSAQGRAKGKAKANGGPMQAGAGAGASKKLSGLAKAPNPDASTSGERDCFLCAEPATYWAVGECGHRTCDVCAVRMRALYKKTECSFCKVSGFDLGGTGLPISRVNLTSWLTSSLWPVQTECPRVVFTSSSTVSYSDLPPAATPFNDTKVSHTPLSSLRPTLGRPPFKASHAKADKSLPLWLILTSPARPRFRDERADGRCGEPAPV